MDSSIEDYAKMLHKDHSENLKELLKVSKKAHEKPEQTAASVALKAKGQKETITLKALDDQKFQVSFIDNMVNDHETAIKKLEEYLKDVHQAEVKDFLETTRKHMEVHLEKAKEIQEKLKATS